MSCLRPLQAVVGRPPAQLRVLRFTDVEREGPRRGRRVFGARFLAAGVRAFFERHGAVALLLTDAAAVRVRVIARSLAQLPLLYEVERVPLLMQCQPCLSRGAPGLRYGGGSHYQFRRRGDGRLLPRGGRGRSTAAPRRRHGEPLRRARRTVHAAFEMAAQNFAFVRERRTAMVFAPCPGLWSKLLLRDALSGGPRVTPLRGGRAKARASRRSTPMQSEQGTARVGCTAQHRGRRSRGAGAAGVIRRDKGRRSRLPSHRIEYFGRRRLKALLRPTTSPPFRHYESEAHSGSAHARKHSSWMQ